MGSVNSTALLLRESSRQSGNKSRKSWFIKLRVMFRGVQLCFLHFCIRSVDRDFEILIIRFRFSLYANLRDYWINSVCSHRMAFQSDTQTGLCTGASLVDLQYDMKTSFINLSSPSLSSRVSNNWVSNHLLYKKTCVLISISYHKFGLSYTAEL